ncbi:hypothetical protein LWI28_017700 [Acer negundo]|uniref:Phytocyanin domain-containing protein n=1 Tax=Acer negundo TaxID=4023 RepID=A0AAD5J4X9_ACENE|nr:hypothetical protein LWI28_017700 [Acer negundo]KAK4847465.1 hypothetical protein QYF36_002246 [Acer negundo]
MGFSADKLMILIVVTASMLVSVSVANKDWYNGGGGGGGFNYTTNWPWGPRNDSHSLNRTSKPNKIIVGGSDHWHYGFNYSVWAFQKNPFYVNDVLVFKYDPPSKSPFKHSVYLLPNMWSYLTCDLSKAKLIATTTQGSGEGFKFVLKKWKPYYFACGEHEGIHCRDGGMKFFVMPMLRRWHY